MRDIDHPLRQSKSANIIETKPVSRKAHEKKRNIRQLSWRGLTGDTANVPVCGVVSSEIEATLAIGYLWVSMKNRIKTVASAVQSSAIRR